MVPPIMKSCPHPEATFLGVYVLVMKGCVSFAPHVTKSTCSKRNVCLISQKVEKKDLSCFIMNTDLD